MEVILKKFEVVKYSLELNNSVGTQTVVVGTSRIKNEGESKDAQVSIVSLQKKEYNKMLDIYRPYLSFQLQKRRFYEVFEVQAICEEFANFYTQIKMKSSDVI